MTLTYTFRDGTTTMDTIEWAVKYEDPEYRQVKQTVIDDHVFVSTIWQGMPDMGDGVPRTFETAALRDGMIVWSRCSRTEEGAIAEHDRIVALIQEAPSPAVVLRALERS